MSRRAIAILFLVGGVLLLGVVAVIFILQSGGDAGDGEEGPPLVVGDTTPGVEDISIPEAETETEGTPQPLREVVVSLQTVPRGWLMTEAELTVDMRRGDLIGDNVITSIEDAVGMYARTDIFQGQTLTKDALVSDPTLVGIEDFGPSSLIPEGFVAMAAPMDRLSGVAYGFDDGDIVDIMITFYVAEVDAEFQTLLQNSATFIVEGTPDEETGEVQRTVFVVDPFGRFENLPNGDLTLFTPSEEQRPSRVSIILQGARVIQVGPWTPAQAPSVPTPTPTPDPQVTPTPEAGAVPTPTPSPPDVVLLALSPQQQLLMKYALETNADVDYALRRTDDGQIYSVENVDLTYLLQRFNIEVPVDFDFTVEPSLATVTPVPEGEQAEEGQ